MDKVIYAVLVVLLVVGGSYAAYVTYMERVENEALAKLYDSVDAIESYEQEVRTRLAVSEREIEVVGTYRNDRAHEVFESFATTTLTSPDAPPYTFALSNIAVKDTLYFKLERVAGSLNSAAPMGPEWYTFTKNTIPAEYVGIAVPGPILDVLALLRNKARALTLVRSVKGDQTFGEPLTQFEYSMAPRSGSEDPTVTSVRERLTGVGTVRVWTDEGVTSVRFIVLSAPNYTSTTTIKSVNIPFAPALPGEAR